MKKELFSRINRNKLSLLSAFLVVLSSCSKLDNSLTEIPVSDTSVSASAHYIGDIAVKFNNAYKALYADNEKIGRSAFDNPDKLFIKIINEAKETLDLAIFDIDEPNACNALIEAQKRGVKVRIITDTDNIEEHRSDLPRKVLQDMRDAGIEIRDDKRTGLMHSKFAIMDSKIVITGSLNLTINSMYRDNNNSLKIGSPELAANYKAEFNRMFEQGLFGPNKHEIPFPTVNVEGASLKVYFSPKGGARNAILTELKNAKKSIKFMAFSMTDKDMQQIILEKVKAGKKVEGIFDGCMISQYSLYSNLLLQKVPVYIDGNQALLHDKVFVIDGNTVITGSYNFSNNAEETNNENTLVIKSSKIASVYNEEYNRLRTASLNNKNIPSYDNRNCSSKIDTGDAEE